ncbi:SDR family oxidoreductase [Brevibacillus migulae]|uniref:SDR family oxidoreductase n=1 Tax=Brevibacillus migulae TaxID=1644114 RepID=UPI00106DF07E|nr:SDR family NAD(P)-dependent oxidoreductase [Brevibacillus migulae]
MRQLQWNFTGKTALVTGGSKGIGREIVTELAEAGARVLFTYAKDEGSAQSLVEECLAKGAEVHAIRCDASSQAEVERLIDTVSAKTAGRLHFLVNNAGSLRDSSIRHMSQEEWQYVMQVSLGSVFTLCKALILPLAYSKGSIVNISSVTGLVGQAGQVNYAAAKAGLIGFTKSLSKELGGLGVRVNAVAPGYIDTNMVSRFSEQRRKELYASISLKRFGSSQEVAQCALFLLSDAASYITGQAYVVDGGLI